MATDHSPHPDVEPDRSRYRWTIATLIALAIWAAVGHPRLGSADETCGGNHGNVTFSTSSQTSTDVVTTKETVRVDTFSTRVVGRDPQGAVVFDQTLALPFADAGVAAAVTEAAALLRTGPLAALVIVDGPALTANGEMLIDTDVTTAETSRMDEFESAETLAMIGPQCIGIGDRDVANTAPCGCPGTTCSPTDVPPIGTPFCVAAGTTNFNTIVHNRRTIQELETTTNTYLVTEEYSLTASLLDHFVLYATKPSKGTPKLAAFGPLTLTDAFGSADYDVKKLPALGLPADKNAEGRADETTHLAQYALKRRATAGKFLKIRDVATSNQCGALTLTLVKPETLLVPVAKDLAAQPPPRAVGDHEVDHFLCYKAKTQKSRSDGTAVAMLPKGTQVDAADQFQTRRYDLKKVTRLCVPVTTSGTPRVLKGGGAVPFVPTARRHPAGHLLCYQAKVASKTIPQNGCGPLDPTNKGTKIVPKQPKHQKLSGVQVNGPLGAASLATTKQLELCIPSTLP